MTVEVTLDLPHGTAEAMQRAPGGLSRELLEAAVLRWFEEGRLSQGQAAVALGLQRGEFFDLLHRHRVSPVQMTPDDLREDFRNG